MPKKRKSNTNTESNNNDNHVNTFLDKEGKIELDKAAKLDTQIGKKQLSVLDIGIRPKQDKIDITCTKCHQQFKIYKSQLSAYVNDKGLPTCNSCMVG